MNKLYVLIIICVLKINNVQAQEYWQQEVKYKIDVDLNSRNHSLKGDLSLTYTNNSPEYLNEVFYHLYWNAFQPGSMLSNMANIPTLFKDNAISDKI